MSIDDRFTGWTIKEAFQRTVDTRAVVRWIEAERALLQCGRIGRHVRSAGVFEDAETERAAARAKEHKARRQALLAARDDACVNVRSPLMRHLRTGKLLALARRGGPTAEQHAIPAAAWKELRIVHVKRSTIEERTEQKLHLHDVRIFPVLAAANAADHLLGRTLIEVCEEFVFDDPQVAALRSRAEAAGGQAATFGFAWDGLRAVWPIDLGKHIDASKRGVSREPKAIALAQHADRVLAKRFSGLIELLAREELAAGIPENGGPTVTIPRSVWHRERMYLDLENGDLFEATPKVRSFWENDAQAPHPQAKSMGDYQRRAQDHERHPKAMFRSLILRWPAIPEILSHARVSDPVPPTTGEPKIDAIRRSIQAADQAEAAFQACVDWLVQIMRANPDRRLRNSKELWEHARKTWPRLSNKAYHRARAQAILASGAKAWRAAGAPPKSKPE